MRFDRLGLALMLIFLALSSQAFAERRVALVIGNSAYRHAPVLPNPRNDAADMAAKLKELGFEVVWGEDLDLGGVRSTIRNFIDRLEGADMALFFYAGHGLQVNGENYIAPVDAQLSSYLDLDFEAVPINLVLSAMERSTKINLVFLDACRDNPLVGNLSRSMGTRSAAVGRGLAKLGSGIGSLIAFATQPGNVALDGEGRNSPFTAALLRHLGTPDQDITRDLVQVRRDVLDSTSGKQVPWETSSLTGDVVLKVRPEAQPAADLDPEPVVSATPAAEDKAVELAFWDTIKTSDDKDLFEVYLQQYPKGAFAPLARIKMTIIDRESAKVAAGELAEKKAVEAARVEVEAERRARDMAALQQTEAVRQLAQPAPDKIDGGVVPQSGELAALTPPSTQDILGGEAAVPDRELVRSVQRELNRVGCGAGSADGLWGNDSRRALEQFVRHGSAQFAALEPSAQVLGRLQSEKRRVCPLVCDRNQKETNGRCVKIVKLKPVEKKRSVVGVPPAIVLPENKKTAAGSCPVDPFKAALQTGKGRVGWKTNFVVDTHSCGRKFACHMLSRKWYCQWM